jgi:hypothetical protein
VLFLYILCATFYPLSSRDAQSLLDVSMLADPENGSVRKVNVQFNLNNKELVNSSSSKVPPRIFNSKVSMQRPFQGPSRSSRRLPTKEENRSQGISSMEPSETQIIGRQLESPKTSTTRVESSLAVEIPEGNISPVSRFYPLSATESSRVVRGFGSAVPSSINSRMSDLSSLYRRQAELNKSVEGLSRYSKNRESKSPAESDFSLSNFPEPPYVKTSFDLNEPGLGNTELILDNTTFSLVPPNIPAAGNREHQASVPLPMQGSENGAMLGVLGARRDRFPSNATRYDVTSFIGGIISL